jgi:hypothetical protein
MIAGACALVAIYWVALTREYYMTNLQATKLTLYLLSGIGIPATALYLYATHRSRSEQRKVHPPLVMSPARDRKFTDQAWQPGAVVLGYDIHGAPWLWTDKMRDARHCTGFDRRRQNYFAQEHHHPVPDAPHGTAGGAAQDSPVFTIRSTWKMTTTWPR